MTDQKPKLSVSVPAQYIKTKTIDWDGEILQCLGVPARFCGVRVAAPSLGVWSILEMIDSKIVKGAPDATFVDVLRALYVLSVKAKALEWLPEWLDAGLKDEPLPTEIESVHEWDRAVIVWSKEAGVKVNDFDHVRLAKWLDLSFSGFEMIPSSGGGQLYLFGAPTYGRILAALGGKFGLTLDRVIWDLPLCLVGHTMAGLAEQNGVKGVGRPKDPDDIKRQLQEATERELAGQLHPWQIEDPEFHLPTQAQREARPEVMAEFRALLEKAAAAQGKKIEEYMMPKV